MSSGSDINGIILETQETFTLTHTVLGKTPGCHTCTGWDGNTGKSMYSSSEEERGEGYKKFLEGDSSPSQVLFCSCDSCDFLSRIGTFKFTL